MSNTISAEVHTDDQIVETSFDAALWFTAATDDQIMKLARCGWGGDYPADEVAIFMADHDPDVTKIFTYIELVHPKTMGFECHVEEDEALAWLAVNNKSHLVTAMFTEQESRA